MCRRFSHKARRYMLGYYHQMKVTEMGEEDTSIDVTSSYIKNEVIHKKYRSHRDANTTDGAFIERVMRECLMIVEQ